MADAGTALVIPGSASGLTAVGSQLFGQDTDGLAGAIEKDDRFGYQVAVGDFSTDDMSDVVISAPGENGNIGQLHSLRGMENGVTTDSSTVIYGGSVTQGFFGAALAVGSFDGSGQAQLAAGGNGPYSDSGGSITIVRSDGTNLSTAGFRTMTQDTTGVPGTDENFDQWGNFLAAADATGDGYDDLLAGAPGEDVGTVVDAGSVTLLKGSSSGLRGTGAQSFSQDSTNASGTAQVPGTAEKQDRFGHGVALLPNATTSLFDAAVGSFAEDLGSVRDAGSITILRATTSGLTVTGATSITPTSVGGSSDTHYLGQGIVG